MLKMEIAAGGVGLVDEEEKKDLGGLYKGMRLGSFQAGDDLVLDFVGHLRKEMICAGFRRSPEAGDDLHCMWRFTVSYTIMHARRPRSR
jgi:hypothetical protein